MDICDDKTKGVGISTIRPNILSFSVYLVMFIIKCWGGRRTRTNEKDQAGTWKSGLKLNSSLWSFVSALAPFPCTQSTFALFLGANSQGSSAYI